MYVLFMSSINVGSLFVLQPLSKQVLSRLYHNRVLSNGRTYRQGTSRSDEKPLSSGKSSISLRNCRVGRKNKREEKGSGSTVMSSIFLITEFQIVDY